MLINSIAIHTNNHCNLNCAGCNHFAPLTKPHFIEIEQFQALLDRLRFLCGTRVQIRIIRLMGGEPLLHPQISDLVQMTRDAFQKTALEIRTNGILLKSMPESFYDVCKNTGTKIVVSDYNILNEKEISDCSKYHRELFRYHYFSETPSLEKCDCPLMFLNEDVQDGIVRKGYTQLNENGDLFFCCIPANMWIYNQYYGKNIPLVENEDYINIFRMKSQLDFSKAIVKRCVIKNFIMTPFCAYCRTPELKEWHKWDKYTNEWVAEEE